MKLAVVVFFLSAVPTLASGLERVVFADQPVKIELDANDTVWAVVPSDSGDPDDEFYFRLSDRWAIRDVFESRGHLYVLNKDGQILALDTSRRGAFRAALPSSTKYGLMVGPLATAVLIPFNWIFGVPVTVSSVGSMLVGFTAGNIIANGLIARLKPVEVLAIDHLADGANFFRSFVTNGVSSVEHVPEQNDYRVIFEEPDRYGPVMLSQLPIKKSVYAFSPQSGLVDCQAWLTAKILPQKLSTR